MLEAVIGEAGLSPRVRGNPTSRIRVSSQGPVYPRVCGGTIGTDDYEGTKKGLSPRVRGNPTSRNRVSSQGPVYPACAGEPDRR